jgi:predicted kinase
VTVPASFHLVCGSTGAGKTTPALRLGQEFGALHFSIDDWMVRLFGPDGRRSATGRGSPSASAAASL